MTKFGVKMLWNDEILAVQIWQILYIFAFPRNVKNSQTSHGYISAFYNISRRNFAKLNILLLAVIVDLVPFAYIKILSID